jgi:hypothetical protein
MIVAYLYRLWSKAGPWYYLFPEAISFRHGQCLSSHPLHIVTSVYIGEELKAVCLLSSIETYVYMYPVEPLKMDARRWWHFSVKYIKVQFQKSPFGQVIYQYVFWGVLHSYNMQSREPFFF